ncbi:phospholipid phosphatase [Companilactobacillus crustorum]|uniref:Membrane-associated phospholipid phosphatase n=4 Tax=Companilactobacillus TaxID=2767879 RepID=A0A837RGN2_9LACO|nr:phosphatase PAP2 family protein [Companilactobacillus crustorum]APU71285.1 hypothetical protein BI355_0966 [Companilactobacillus crustorum]KRK40656.1 membrane-associated phospholipid phosphatase [Companilactobacillus crustorum JCM 15951]KRO17074.1 membrane-associated phospholipid phosphatase [Companilactobacillus crustorum]GEO77645.1 phospholipid phosphatase [Companilactobacillus crustorum]
MLFSNDKNQGIKSFSWLLAFTFLLIAVGMRAKWLINLDSMLQRITTIAGDSSMAKFFEFITFFGSPMIVLLLSVVLIIYFLIKKESVTSLWIAFTILGGDALAFIIKETVQRPRPSNIIGGDTGYSFPSGHVFGTMILVMLIVKIVVPRLKSYENIFLLKNISGLWLLIVIISRICLRSHYPSDAVGSIFLAIGWWNFSEVLYLRYYDLASQVISKLKS